MTLPRSTPRRIALAHHRRAAAGGLVAATARLARAVLAGGGRLWRIRLNRRATIALLDLDAERLADLGLTRADVRASLFDPRSPDPTGMLETLAAERRTAWRRRG